MKSIIKSFLVIFGMTALVSSATFAFFNDTEVSKGNTFTAGMIDLRIDLQCNNEFGPCGITIPRDLRNDQFFHECDVKPGDVGEVTISWHVFDNPAWGRIKLANVDNWEYDCNEPEITYGDTSCPDPGDIYDTGEGLGELQDYFYFDVWVDDGYTAGWDCPPLEPSCAADPGEGDNIWQDRENLLADNWTLQNMVDIGVAMPDILYPDVTHYMGFQWEIPFSTPNIAQTDSFIADIVMEVVQSRHNPNPWGTN